MDLFLTVAAIVICGSVAVAAGVFAQVHAHYVAVGAPLAIVGLAILGFVASSSLEEGHYDDFGGAMMELVSLVGAGLLIISFGPLVAWLLNLPSTRPPTSPAATAVAMTAAATAMAVSALIVNIATTAQDRATYQPESRIGALTVTTTDGVPTVAELQRKLPGATIVQDLRPVWPGMVDAGMELRTGRYDSLYIGDETLLHYLTADTPYDENTAVLINPDEVESSVRLPYHFTQTEPGFHEAHVPATRVYLPDFPISAVFVPAKVVRDLGFMLIPERLIAMPVSAAEFQDGYLERGFQPSTDWWYFVGVMLLLAVAAGLSIRRHAPLHTAFGAALGGLTGCAIGLLHSWPATTSADWDPPPRVPFETPWLLVVVVVVVAALGGVRGRRASG
ncbi:hypothetical protein ACIBG8_12480 [Nonomuraea sp. NPDC050556]|uniref:hypothetical protein n=1 Tax=Nonomuraea sp. NPDC050556 TaxID=3364369 RepID=UPI00378AE0FF